MEKELNKNLKEEFIVKFFDNIYNNNFFKNIEPKKQRNRLQTNPRYRKLFLELVKQEQLKYYILDSVSPRTKVAIAEKQMNLVIKKWEKINTKRVNKIKKGTIFAFKCEVEDFYRYGVVTYDEKTSIGSSLYFYILDYKSREIKYDKNKITKDEILIPVPYKIDKIDYKEIKILDIICDIDDELRHSLYNISFPAGEKIRDWNDIQLKEELPLHCIHDPAERITKYFGRMIERWEKILFKNFDREYLFDLFMNEYEEANEIDELLDYKEEFKKYLMENIDNINFEYCEPQENDKGITLEILEEDNKYSIDFYWEEIDKIIDLLEKRDLDEEDFTNIVIRYLEEKISLDEMVISQGTGQIYIEAKDKKVIQKVKNSLEKLVNSKTILNKKVKEYNS